MATLTLAGLSAIDPDALVFLTGRGTKRDRSNILWDVLRPAVESTKERRAEKELPPITEGVTNHTLRRTFASRLYEAGGFTRPRHGPDGAHERRPGA